MERIPNYVKTMIGSGVGTVLSGAGLWIGQTYGMPLLGIHAFGVAGLALTVLGTTATAVQFYRHTTDRH